MYINPDVTERHVTAVITFACTDTHDTVLRDEIVERLTALVSELGHNVEIHHERMLAETEARS